MIDPHSPCPVLEFATDWREQNKQAVDSANKWVEIHRLPLADRRQF